ncbi:uncharacterized protein LOC129582132 isoform X2 [Paramacrobiotus metropolitanus]|uniref:uncharacterized protein LOC129582132 isoform X2 n=1 Tax=Paramacrobiotus metropolitanus TaxID=2943436 RepID=UPI002445E9EE|nr:uncharacterized protein LOC129582132 isoform X2 [Paramacrobiotus metropolitanus]
MALRAATVVAKTVMEAGVADASHAAGEGLAEASKIPEITPKVPKEFQVNTPREVELPGTKGPPEVQPGHYQGEKKEIDIGSPKEIGFPDPKTVPEVKPGESVEIKHMEKEAELDQKEQDILDKITKNVPADPSNINPVIEQARHQERPEVGEVRATVEVDRNDRQQESTDDGQRQLDVNSANSGPEMGRNPLNEQI